MGILASVEHLRIRNINWPARTVGAVAPWTPRNDIL